MEDYKGKIIKLLEGAPAYKLKVVYAFVKKYLEQMDENQRKLEVLHIWAKGYEEMKTNEDMKREITNLLEAVEDGWILEQIYRCIINITK